MAHHISRWLLVAIALALVLASVQRATAAPALQTTDTPTPTPTATPNYVTGVTLDSGNTLIIERRWTFGELADFLAIVGFAALWSLRWIYEIAKREVR